MSPDASVFLARAGLEGSCSLLPSNIREAKVVPSIPSDASWLSQLLIGELLGVTPQAIVLNIRVVYAQDVEEVPELLHDVVIVHWIAYRVIEYVTVLEW